MPRRHPLVLLFLVLLSTPLYGQRTPDRPPIDLTPPAAEVRPSKTDPLSGSIFADWGVPVGAFHRNEDGGGGLGVHGAYALDHARHVALRLEAGLFTYGYVTGRANVPEYDESGNYQGNTSVGYVVRQHDMYSLDFGPEVTALRGRIRPYAFATTGLSFFRSSVNIRPPESNTDGGDDRTIFSAGNFAWSTGLGLRIAAHDARSGTFDFGVRFRRNARAHYVNDRSFTNMPDGSVLVRPFYGSANVITIYAGAWVGPKGRG